MKSSEEKQDDFKPVRDYKSPGPSTDDHRPGSGQSTCPKSHTLPLKTPQTIHFYSGNPMVEKTRGILHLYKEK